MSLSAIIVPHKIGLSIVNKIVCSVTSYDLKGKNCFLYWYVVEDGIEDEIVKEGSYTVPASILAQWGENDDIIIRDLANHLGFSIVEILN